MGARSPDTAQQSVVGFNNVLYRNVIADANVTYVQKTNTSDNHIDEKLGVRKGKIKLSAAIISGVFLSLLSIKVVILCLVHQLQTMQHLFQQILLIL